MKQLIDTIKNFLGDPKKYFKTLPKRKNLREAFMFYFYVEIIIVALSMIVYAFQATSTVQPQLTTAIIIAGVILFGVLALAMALAQLFIAAGVQHLFLKIVQAKNAFKETFNMMVYAAIPSLAVAPVIIILQLPIVAAPENAALQLAFTIPIFAISIAAFVYTAYLYVVGAKIVHQISTMKAVLAMIIFPLALWAVIITVFLAAIISLITAAAV